MRKTSPLAKKPAQFNSTNDFSNGIAFAVHVLMRQIHLLIFLVLVFALALAVAVTPARASSDFECKQALVGGDGVRSSLEIVFDKQHLISAKAFAGTELLGRIEYELLKDSKVLKVQVMKMRLKRHGVSKKIMAAILDRHPEIQEIEGTIMFDNLEAFNHEARQGKATRLAVLATPFYKTMSHFGFSRINARSGVKMFRPYAEMPIDDVTPAIELTPTSQLIVVLEKQSDLSY